MRMSKQVHIFKWVYVSLTTLLASALPAHYTFGQEKTVLNESSGNRHIVMHDFELTVPDENTLKKPINSALREKRMDFEPPGARSAFVPPATPMTPRHSAKEEKKEKNWLSRYMSKNDRDDPGAEPASGCGWLADDVFTREHDEEEEELQEQRNENRKRFFNSPETSFSSAAGFKEGTREWRAENAEARSTVYDETARGAEASRFTDPEKHRSVWTSTRDGKNFYSFNRYDEPVSEGFSYRRDDRKGLAPIREDFATRNKRFFSSGRNDILSSYSFTKEGRGFDPTLNKNFSSPMRSFFSGRDTSSDNHNQDAPSRKRVSDSSFDALFNPPSDSLKIMLGKK